MPATSSGRCRKGARCLGLQVFREGFYECSSRKALVFWNSQDSAAGAFVQPLERFLSCRGLCDFLLSQRTQIFSVLHGLLHALQFEQSIDVLRSEATRVVAAQDNRGDFDSNTLQFSVRFERLR